MSSLFFSINFWIITALSKTLIIYPLRIKKNATGVLFLENFPIDNAGYQYRAKKWGEILKKEEDFKVVIKTIYESKIKFDYVLSHKRQLFLIFSMYKRFFQILSSLSYETVVVRRELLLYNDYGNLFMEKLLLRIHPNAILDFDDDLAAAKGQPKKITNWYARLMREHGNKFNESLRLYKRLIVASNYLKDRVLKENPNLNPNNIVVIPTCVDYDKYPRKKYPQQIKEITFGWIGGDHNYPQLRQVIPFLNKLSKSHDCKLIVIGGSDFESEAEFKVEFIPWSLSTEVENLYKIDIGLMPLAETNATKGKGGFKLIQYMGLGIVSVASAITINEEIVSDGKDGFLVEKESDWLEVLSKVLSQKENYSKIGELAALKIKNNYSFTGNSSEYVGFIEKNSCL